MKNKRYGGRISVKKNFIKMKPKYLDMNRNIMPFPLPVPAPVPIVSQQPPSREHVSQQEIDDIFLGYSTRRGGRKTKNSKKTRKSMKSRKNKSKKYRK